MGALRRQVIPMLLTGAFILLLASACRNEDASSGSTPAKQVNGQVLEVVGRNILEVETLRIRDATGKEWTFMTEGFVGFTPSHIRQHQLFGEPVSVSYIEKGAVLVAVEVTD